GVLLDAAPERNEGAPREDAEGGRRRVREPGRDQHAGGQHRVAREQRDLLAREKRRRRDPSRPRTACRKDRGHAMKTSTTTSAKRVATTSFKRDLIDFVIDDTMLGSKRLRRMTARVLRAQQTLRRLVDDRAWAAYLDLEN